MKRRVSNNRRFLIGMISDVFDSARVDDFIRAQPDWRRLPDESVREGVFYPFYRNLLALGGKARLIPDEFQEAYRQLYYLHLSESAELSGRIESILGRIDALGIPALVVKGPATDSHIYDGFFRARLDLDIVVAEGDLPAVEQALEGLGYSAQPAPADYPLPEYRNSTLFTGAAGTLPVHVHRHLINNMFLTVDSALGIDMAKIWRETEPFEKYRHLCVLKPGLNIIYLCEHGLRHDFEQLVYMHEIDRMIRHYGDRFSWEDFVSLTSDVGLERIVYYGLYFTREILAGSVPAHVLAALKPARLTAGEKRFIKDTLEGRQNRYGSYPIYVAWRKGLVKRARFRLLTVFPPGFTLQGYCKRLRNLILR